MKKNGWAGDGKLVSTGEIWLLLAKFAVRFSFAAVVAAAHS